jgi:hypothetical protein
MSEGPQRGLKLPFEGPEQHCVQQTGPARLSYRARPGVTKRMLSSSVGRATKAPYADRERLEHVQIMLDQSWDMLRQRRARLAAGLDPDEPQVTDAKTSGTKSGDARANREGVGRPRIARSTPVGAAAAPPTDARAPHG